MLHSQIVALTTGEDTCVLYKTCTTRLTKVIIVQHSLSAEKTGQSLRYGQKLVAAPTHKSANSKVPLWLPLNPVRPVSPCWFCKFALALCAAAACHQPLQNTLFHLIQLARS